jgi:ankyrin repeat protein
MPSYKYQPIPLGQGVFRLLRIFKGLSTDGIRCELFQATQAEGVTYEALSYTWGSDVVLEDITLEGRGEGSAMKETKIRIRTNLHTALRYLRSETRDRVLWIDALCIDQGNDEEKADQIQQMRLVYENAEQVLIWLGQSNERIDIIMDSMAWVHQEATANYVDWRDPARRLGIAGPIFRQLEDTSSTSYLQQPDSFRELLRRSWFQRVWVLQEVASARTAIIICGSKSVQAYIFALMPSLLGLEVDSHTQAILEIFPEQSRKRSWWSNRRDLHFLLKKFAGSLATDYRDKVFALLGISSDAYKAEVFPVHYTKSFDEVCRDTLCFLLFKKVLPSSVIMLPILTLPTLLLYLDNLPELATSVIKLAIANRHELTSAFLMEVGRYAAPEGTFANMVELGGYNLLIKYFLSCNTVDIHVANGSGETALNIAARRGDEKTVALLLGCSQIDVDHKNFDGITPLAAAAIHGHLSIAKLLLDRKAGIDMNHKDIDGITPLAAAVIHGHHLIVRLLLGHEEVDFNEGGPLGTMLLVIAAILGHLPVLWALIVHSNFELDEPNGLPKGRRLVDIRRALLSIMARDDDEAGLKSLMNRGVHFNISDDNGHTPLARAAMAGAISTMKALLCSELASPIFVDACKDSRGRTPLSLAAERGNFKACKYLMIAGADRHAKDHGGKSAMDWARDKDELDKMWLCIVEKVSSMLEGYTGTMGPGDSGKLIPYILKIWRVADMCKRDVETYFREMSII